MFIDDEQCPTTEPERTQWRMRNFHRKRVEAIQQERLDGKRDPSALVVHFIPEEAVRTPKSFSAAHLGQAAKGLTLLGRSKYGSQRYNADGVIVCDKSEDYAQLHRDGTYEGVMNAVVVKHKQDVLVLRVTECEKAIIGAFDEYLPFVKAVGVTLPVWMFSAVVGCKGGRILYNYPFDEFSDHAVDRNIVWLPETKIEAVDDDSAQHLRPVFDVLWNAAGMEGSLNYNKEGRREPQKNIL